MEQRDVLSLDSIDRIRGYVKHKYVHLPKEKHAEIVADAIVKIIERQLPPLQAEVKQQLCNELIAKVVVKEQRPVSLMDIDQACEQIVVKDEETSRLINQWRVDHGLQEVLKPVSQDKLSEKLHRRHTSKVIRKSILYAVGCCIIVLSVVAFQFAQQEKGTQGVAREPLTSIEEIAALPYNELPALYQYQTIDHDKLKEYLASRDSILVEEPYFSAIVATAKEFNLSVVLLFAITGQEQGFVNKEHELAQKIANNPFNVFYSWEDYNTTIEDTSAIAARTIVNLSKDRPEDVDPIVWINRKYAEDPNWSKGVSSLFQTITNYINN